MACKLCNVGGENPHNFKIDDEVIEDAGTTNERKGRITWIGRYKIAAMVSLEDNKGTAMVRLSDLSPCKKQENV